MSTASKNPLIPQVSPHRDYLIHKDEIDSAIASVLSSGSYILGSQSESFEDEFGEYLGLEKSSVVGVANGTDALVLILKAIGVSPGDGVIIPSHTASAVGSAVAQCGAIPLFADIDPSTMCIAATSAHAIIEKHSKSIKISAIIVVHMYGQPAALDEFVALSRTTGLPLIEDCSQAHGAMYRGQKVGTFGIAAAFSFYPTKNLGALGDGGAAVTSNPDLFKKIQLLRQYGWEKRYFSEVEGQNSRLDELQAAILRVKLRYLDQDNERRASIASAYSKVGLSRSIDLTHPSKQVDSHSAYHQYVLRTPKRDELKAALLNEGIQTAIHYPFPIHQQPAYQKYWRWMIDLTETERISDQILSLPIFPSLTDLEVTRVVDGLSTFIAREQAIPIEMQATAY
jgi:dTDP-4-amino-4,6-dideoxygalactose transaminase